MNVNDIVSLSPLYPPYFARRYPMMANYARECGLEGWKVMRINGARVKLFKQGVTLNSVPVMYVVENSPVGRKGNKDGM